MERNLDDEILYCEIVAELKDMGFDDNEARMYARDMMEPDGTNG